MAFATVAIARVCPDSLLCHAKSRACADESLASGAFRNVGGTAGTHSELLDISKLDFAKDGLDWGSHKPELGTRDVR